MRTPIKLRTLSQYLTASRTVLPIAFALCPGDRSGMGGWVGERPLGCSNAVMLKMMIDVTSMKYK
jgi:hypothetical protein